MKSFADIPAVLEQRKADDLYRRRIVLQSPQSTQVTIDGEALLSFCSNDYLGLANHPEIRVAFQQSLLDDGVGAGASHLVDGHHHQHEALERELAQFLGREAALVFGSGYMANVGTISALLQRGDTVVQDRLNHASLIDGALLSQAHFKRYRHNDVAHAGALLSAAAGKKLLVTDGVFSMDGDCAPLTQLSELCTEHDAWLMVDDAHGVGVLGPSGRGTVAEAGLAQAQVPILIGTLGKAFGTSGAFVAGAQSVIDYLIQFARPYIYTTASPPALAAATRKALHIVQSADDRRAHLNALIERFRTGARDLGFQLMASQTPIQPIVVGDNNRALALSASLRARGLLVTAIRPPTVPVGSARLRITLSASHTHEDLDSLLNSLESLR